MFHKYRANYLFAITLNVIFLALEFCVLKHQKLGKWMMYLVSIRLC